MSDLGDQSNDLNRRIESAGGTDLLMKGLVRSVRRARLILTVAIIGLVLDLLLSLGLIFGLVNLHKTDDKNLEQSKSIAKNSKRVCEARNTAAIAHNRLVDALITALANGTGLPPAERETRSARYAATRVEIIKC